MDITNTLAVYTYREAIMLTVAVLLPYLFIFGYLKYEGNADRTTTKSILISFISLLIIFPLVAVGVKELFGSINGGYIKIALIFSILIAIQNLTLLIAKYISEIKSKKSDMDHVSRAHFDTSLKSIIVLMILILSTTPFVPVQIVSLIILGFMTPILMIVVLHFGLRAIAQNS